MKILLAGAFVLAASAAAQTSAPAAPPQAPAATAAVRTWSDATLHLTFTYPGDLSPMDPKTLPGAAHNAAYAEDPDAEPDNALTGRCARVLLSVGKTGPTWGSILVTELDSGCLPPNALKSRHGMDKVLNPLVSAGTQILGMAPVVSAMTYTLEGHRVHFSEAEGHPVVAADLQPNGPQQTIVVLAVQVGDSVLSWKIESNDPALLNRALASRIDFGTGTPLALLPLQIPGKN